MSFNESNTVEAYLYDLLSGPGKQPVAANVAQQTEAGYGRAHKGLGWRRVESRDIPRQATGSAGRTLGTRRADSPQPEIAALPDRADEVLYKLRAIILSVRSDGVIRANEEMTAWLRGERSMPFGQNNEHVPVRLIDFDDFDQNQYVITQQFTCRAGSAERRAI